MNGGGIADKRGNWYEEHYVLLQALRVLAGDVESLRWERGGDEEDGIDCALREGGVPIESQCKTRSKDQWTLKRLSQGSDDGPGFLEYARRKLDADAACQVRFVTDARGPELEKTIDVGRRAGDSQAWAETPAVGGTLPDLLAAWSLADDVTGRARAFDLIRRIDFRVEDKAAMAEFIGTLARLLAGADAALLCGELLKHLKATLKRIDSGHTRNTVRVLPEMTKQVVLLVYEDELPPDLVRTELRGKLRAEWRLERRYARHTDIVPRKD